VRHHSKTADERRPEAVTKSSNPSPSIFLRGVRGKTYANSRHEFAACYKQNQGKAITRSARRMGRGQRQITNP
jgi:hypothetical protein